MPAGRRGPCRPRRRSGRRCARRGRAWSSDRRPNRAAPRCPACSACAALGLEVGGEDRGEHEQPGDDAGMAGGDRPAPVDRLRRASLERGLGQRGEGQREADSRPVPAAAASARPTRRAAGRARRARPRSGSRRRRRAAPTSGTRRGQRSRRDRADRHRGHRGGGRDRRQPPALDQQQDDEEQRRGQRGGDQRERGVRREMRSAGRADARRGAVAVGRLGANGARERGGAQRARSAPAGGRSTPRRRAR